MVALTPLEMVATHPMMADHGLDVGLIASLRARAMT
jgi:hypothetical protein